MAYFPVPDDAFKDALPKSVGDYLVIILNWLWNAVAKVTTHATHVYVNGTTGDDANDGLSAGTPKKTLLAAAALLPDKLKHSTMLHLAGVISEQELPRLKINKSPKIRLIIDGGDGLTVVADDGGNPWTADISSITSLGLTTLGWIPNQHRGWWVEVVDGPAAGQTRTIYSHTATTITPNRNWSVDPGNAQFRVVRPSTEIAASSAYSLLHIMGDVLDSVPNLVQRLYFSGTKFLMRLGAGNISLGQCILNSSFDPAIQIGSDADYIYFNRGYMDSNFAMHLAITDPQPGVSVLQSSIKQYGGRVHAISLNAGLVRLSAIASLLAGTHIQQLECYELSRGLETTNIFDSSGYAVTGFGGGASGIGILAMNSHLRIGANVDISDCSSHGIESVKSLIHLDGDVKGTGNAGACVYAHSGSVVHIKNGSPPTLTGTIGDISTDGTTEATTFAAVDGGETYSDDLENTTIKELA